MKNRYSIIVFLIIAAVFVLHSVYLAVPAEDSFISFRYAKNLANGEGLVWNVGENPVEGYTNFLWIIICSIGLFAGFDIIIFSQVLGILSGLLVLLYSFLFSKKVLGFSNLTSMLPPVLLAFSGPLAVWSSSGMETSLFTFFVIAACYYTSILLINRKIRIVSLSSIFCLLATLTRPEGLGIFLLLFTFQIIVLLNDNDSPKIYGTLIPGFLIYFIPFLIYFIWRFSFYGELLPLTFYAKTGGTFFQWFRGLKYLLFFLFHFILPLLPVLLLFIWGRSNWIKRISSSTKSLPEEGINKFLAVVLLCYINFGYILYIVFIGGDYMAMYRFFVPILPMIYILFARINFYFIHNFVLTPVKKHFIVFLVFVAISGTYIQSTPIEKFLFNKPAITHGQYDGVLFERWQVNRLSLIGEFFNDYKNNENESLATDAIGAISFYSNMKIYGLHGLDDPVIAKMKFDNLGRGFPGHEKSDIKHILLKKPTYYMLTRELHDTHLNIPYYSTEVDSIFRNDYKTVSVWLEDKQNDDSGYFTFLQRKDKTIIH